MGSKLSRFLTSWQTARHVSELLQQLSIKISQSPGIPVPDPSISYWTDPPSPISRHGEKDVIPSYADIVIIGSGITGAAIARTILDNYIPSDSKPLKIVMLEAREVCSGATGRNGGHITPVLYSDYQDLKEEHGIEMAQKIIRFRLAHIKNLLVVAEQENLLSQSQCREVDTFDAFFDRGLFNSAKQQLSVYKADLPVESGPFRVIEDAQEIKRLQLSQRVIGCISTIGGAIHPYRLVTGILSRLLQQYPLHFHIFARTPCISIGTQIQSSDSKAPYIVRTPRGDINAFHVIHATNGWTSHLLPGLRQKVIPVRGNMTAQRPGNGLGKTPDVLRDGNGGEKSNWTGQRSFVFYPSASKTRFDYLTQQPAPTGLENDGLATGELISTGEMMFGGGFLQGGPDMAGTNFFEAIGSADDSAWDFSVTSFLTGALGLYFQPGWGRESCSRRENEGKNNKWDKGRLIAPWSGILGISADNFPWVGRIPDEVTERPIQKSIRVHDASQPRFSEKPSNSCSAIGLSSPGEWICAAYTGEGMPHAWMCGTALAHMILKTNNIPPLDPTAPYPAGIGERKGVGDNVIEWLPDVFLVTEERWKKANFDDWLGNIGR